MLNNHNIKLGVEALIYDKDGNLKDIKYISTPNEALKAKLNYEILNNKNEIVEQNELPFKSFTYAYAGHIFTGITNTIYTIVNITGIPRAILSTYYDLSDVTLAGVTYRGIVVGTGSLQNSSSVYNVGLINHGTSSNELIYNPSAMIAPYYSGSAYYTNLNRTFSNWTTESINVNEIGVYSSNLNYLSIRDIYDNTGSLLNLNIPPSGTLNVNYKFYVDDECGLNLNWLRFLYHSHTNTYAYSIINILNQSGQVELKTYLISLDFSSTGSIKGIVCGTGSTAVTLEDYKLSYLIENGMSANKLLYKPHSYTSLQNYLTVSSSVSFQISRQFENSSGAPIEINEVGIYGSEDTSYPIATTDTFLYSRFLTGGISLNDGEVVDFRFIWQFDLS